MTHPIAWLTQTLLRSITMVLLVGSIVPTGRAEESKSLPAKVENFQLLDHEGNSCELYRQKLSKVVVLFVAGNGCPIVRQSSGALKALEQEFGPKGTTFWMLNANSQDDRESIAKEAKEFGIELPILIDQGQWVAESLGIRRTAEAIAINTHDWTIFYRGAVDDRLGYGTQKAQPDHAYLSEALKAFFAGKPVETPSSQVKGCAITFPNAADRGAGKVTFTRQVAPILAKHCVSCHSTGNIGPFAMTNYEKVKGWSSTLREVLLERRMPPWTADPHYGSFKNSRGMSLEETRTILDWIADGSPRGEGTDPMASLAVPSPSEWALGKPDLVISMPETFTVPATGVVPYQYFPVEVPITEDAWVRAAVVKAGNPKVLHHALIFVKYPEALKSIEPRQNAGTAGYFAGFVPGAVPSSFPEGTGKFLPKGSTLIFQMHYAPTGKQETDRTELGLYLLPTKPSLELRTRAVTQQELAIGPGVSNYKAQASYQFKREAVLHSLSPHMHVRGNSFKYDLVYPDGKTETLLSVPRWDFGWQTLYQLKEPKRIPAGSQLVCSGTFDNSIANPANPDPKQWVTFGEQTTDEMFIGYYDIAMPPQEVKKVTKSAKPAEAGSEPK